MSRLILHTISGLVLCLSLLIAGVAGASAGVAMLLAEGETEFVVCNEGGPRIVAVDALGRVGNPHKTCVRCPACTLATGLAAPSPTLLSRPVIAGRLHLSFISVSQDLRQAIGLPSARAPPARV